MDLDSTVRRNPEVVARGLAEQEGGVLLHLETGAYHGLNQVGLLIWEMLEGDHTVADLIEGVRNRIEGGPPGLEQDVVGFLDSARERDLILVVE